MLFKDILDQKTGDLYPIFDKFHDVAGKNQTHPGDLLLVHENAFYNPEVHTWDNIKEKLSPYMKGLGQEGHSAYTHHDFIGEYIHKNTIATPYAEYVHNHNYTEARRDEIRKLEFEESISIQIEMLIYLKIWESDQLIKQLYQLVLLLNGESYDWHFKIKETNRDTEGTGTREKILRIKTRDRIKRFIPELYDSLKTTYITQIRNSIAHSQYSIMGRNIQLNNYVESDPASQLRSVTFDNWVDIFHETIVFYTQLQRMLDEINKNYGILAMKNDDQFEIRINRRDPIIEVQYFNLHHRLGDWGWHKD